MRRILLTLASSTAVLAAAAVTQAAPGVNHSGLSKHGLILAQAAGSAGGGASTAGAAGTGATTGGAVAPGTSGTGIGPGSATGPTVPHPVAPNVAPLNTPQTGQTVEPGTTSPSATTNPSANSSTSILQPPSTVPQPATNAQMGMVGQQNTGLSAAQRTGLRSSIVAESSDTLGNADADLSVGATLPRSVQLSSLPANATAIAPAYAGFKYVTAKNGSIYVVDPASYRIVAVLKG